MEHLATRRVLCAFFSLVIASFLFAAKAFAAATAQEVKGEVRTSVRAEAPTPVEKGQRVLTGSTVTTGPNSQVVLMFDDGQQVVLNEDTQFFITDYQFVKEDPKSDRSIFTLLRGAARTVTGALALRSREAFELRAPTATIGIRGTDFMVAIVDQPTYLSVLQGEVAATNLAGTATFAAGSYASITAATVLAVAIPLAAVPAAAAAAFGNMGAAAVGAAAGAGGIGAAGAVGAAAAAAGVAAAAGSKSSSSSSSTTTNPFAGSWSGTDTIVWSGTVGGTSFNGTCTRPFSGTVSSTGLLSASASTATCTGDTNGVLAQVTTSVPAYALQFPASAGSSTIAGPAPLSTSGLTISVGSLNTTTTLTPTKTISYTTSLSITGSLSGSSVNLTASDSGSATGN